MQERSNKLYETMDPVKLFFHAAIPGVISMFSMSIYNIIEGIFVGQLIGGEAFAAMNLAMPLVMLNYALADMVGVGASIPISIALGEKNEKKANNYFSGSVILIFSLAAAVGALLFLFAPQLMGLMGAEESVTKLAVEYLQVSALFSPFVTIVFAMDNYLRISGFVRQSMYLNLFMCGLQIALLVLFVGVWKMGLTGSAISINLAMGLCGFIALVPFVRKKAVLRFVRPSFSFAMMKEVVACGMPVFFNNMAGRLFSLIMNVLLIRMGGTLAVSTYSVLMYASELIGPMLYGLSDSVQPAIGYNWGAKDYGRVKALAKCVFTASAVVSLAAMAINMLFAPQLVGMFVDSGETALRELSVHAMRVFSVKYLFWWFGFAALGFYNAIEKPKNATILTLSNVIVFPLLMVALLWPLQLDGLWLNQAATYIPVNIIAFVMLRKTQKEIGKMKKEQK